MTPVAGSNFFRAMSGGRVVWTRGGLSRRRTNSPASVQMATRSPNGEATAITSPGTAGRSIGCQTAGSPRLLPLIERLPLQHDGDSGPAALRRLHHRIDAAAQRRVPGPAGRGV